MFDAATPLAGVAGYLAEVDINVTDTPLPAWWLLQNGQCRANAVVAQYGAFDPGAGCPVWWAPSGLPEPLGVYQVTYHPGGSVIVRISISAAVPAGSEVTIPEGQEVAVFRIRVGRTKTTGSGACAGCPSPACIGFGYLGLMYPGTPARADHVGSPASVATWQGASVLGYAPVAGHSEGTAYVSYSASLQCSAAPAPAQGRTWGLIKSLYR